MNKLGYETDYYQWTQVMAKALRERDYSRIDWDNLIEEIEDLDNKLICHCTEIN